MSRRVAPAGGIKIDYGHGPEPATVAQLFRTLRFVAAMQKKRRAPIVHVPERRELSRVQVDGEHAAQVRAATGRPDYRTTSLSRHL